jgi:hypothetical protein
MVDQLRGENGGSVSPEKQQATIQQRDRASLDLNGASKKEKGQLRGWPFCNR